MFNYSYLLVIDPSIVSPGVALFCKGVLIRSARLRIKPEKVDAAKRCRNAITAIRMWMGDFGRPDEVVFEYPQIYAHDTPATANAVIAMAGVGMGVATHYLEAVVTSYYPREWSQLPKCKTGSYWKSPRGKRVWSRLSESERAVAGDQHDQGDAIGIGLHHLGRLAIQHAPFSAT